MSKFTTLGKPVFIGFCRVEHQHQQTLKGTLPHILLWEVGRYAMPQAQGVILNQKSVIKNINSHSVSHVQPQTEMLCLMSPTKISSYSWVKGVFPRAQLQGRILGALQLAGSQKNLFWSFSYNGFSMKCSASLIR